jgi:hypothetical protein
VVFNTIFNSVDEAPSLERIEFADNEGAKSLPKARGKVEMILQLVSPWPVNPLGKLRMVTIKSHPFEYHYSTELILEKTMIFWTWNVFERIGKIVHCAVNSWLIYIH